MFIKLFLIGIILFIIINQFIENNNSLKVQENNEAQKLEQEINMIQSKPIMIQNNESLSEFPKLEREIYNTIQPEINIIHHNELQSKSTRLEHYTEPMSENDINIKPEIPLQRSLESKVQEFDRPYPWSKIIYNEGDDYPYYYHIKITIPSLNDYENWKKIIPNIEFNPNTKEIIIPSKDDASALAIANLMCINLSGQMTIQEILKKDLIRISITKAKTHEVVRNKLKEQIMEVIYGKSFNTVQTKYEEDLAKNGLSETKNIKIKTETPSLKSDNFRDTFQHFSDENNEISAYDGGNYSYL